MPLIIISRFPWESMCLAYVDQCLSLPQNPITRSVETSPCAVLCPLFSSFTERRHAANPSKPALWSFCDLRVTFKFASCTTCYKKLPCGESTLKSFKGGKWLTTFEEQTLNCAISPLSVKICCFSIKGWKYKTFCLRPIHQFIQNNRQINWLLKEQFNNLALVVEFSI